MSVAGGSQGIGRAEEVDPRPIAYIMSRFPKLTETFILFEMLAVERLGERIELFPLLRYSEPLSHPEAAGFVARAHYQPFLSRSILGSQLHTLRHRPRAYLGALLGLMTGTFGSRNYFFGGLAIFPKVVHLVREMEALGVRHVHCHFSNHPAAAGFVIRRLTGIPYSFVAHGSDLHVDRHMLPAKVREAAFAVAISEDNRAEMVEECGDWARTRIEVIHCGVDTDQLRPPTEARDPNHPFTITAIGTLHEVKGQAVLLEACRLLHAHGRDIRCRLIGAGPDEAALRDQVATAGLTDIVRFDGQRTRAEVIAALGEADLLAAPSVHASDGKREGIPVVLMEAMSCGLPVVASRLSGIPELVEDEVDGLLVAPGDAPALATAIARVMDDVELRERIGAAARAKVKRDFDLLTNARRVVGLIDRSSPQAIAEGRAAGSPLPSRSSVRPDEAATVNHP
jgi:colanic acid/amylovoran biosynthesis glycosyltransferase